MRKLLFLFICFILGPGLAFAQNIKFAFPLQNNTSNISPYPANCTGSIEDKQGNHYIVGNIVDTVDVDPGPDTFYLYQPEIRNNVTNSLESKFLIKYSENGEFIWAQRFFTYYGTGDIQVSINENSRIIIAGTCGAFLMHDRGNVWDTIYKQSNFSKPETNIFLFELDTNGVIIKKKRSYTPADINLYMGAGINSIELDELNNIYVTGSMLGKNYLGDSLDENFSFETSLNLGGKFVAKYDSNFTIQWVKMLPANISLTRIKFDSERQQLLICGDFGDTLDLNINGINKTFFAGISPTIPLYFEFGRNALILKVSLNGDITSVHQIYSPGVQGNASISTDKYGNIFYANKTFVFPNIFINDTLYNWTLFGQDEQLFIMAFDSAFTHKWHYISQGNGGNTAILDSEVDSAGNLIVCGSFSGGSRNFARLGQPPFSMSAINYQNNGDLTDGFVVKYSKTGKLIRARKISVSGFDQINSIKLNKENDLFISGFYQDAGSLNFQNTALNQVSTNGPRNGFFGKYSQCITRTQIRDTICYGTTKSFDGETLSKPGKYIRLKSYNSTTQCEVWEELYLHVRPELNASAGKDSTLCAGKKLTLGSDSIIKTTYNWQQIGGSFTSTKAKPNINFENNSDTLQTYTYAYQASQLGSGCQKRDTVSIKVLPRKRSILSQAICKGQTYLGYDTAGVYVDTLFSQSGCDSIRTLTLSIKPIQTKIQTVNLCQGQSLQVGIRIYSISGIYKDTITASNGCDSIITSTLNYSIANDTIIANGLSYSAADNQDSYQWLDCNQDFQAIAGATQQTFTPTSNGSFAVKTTKGNCADTSDCVLFTSGKDLLTSKIRIYPQPVKDKLYIEMPETSQTTELVLLDALGRIVFKEKGRYIPSISVSKLPAGLYQLKIFQGNQIEVFGVMVEK